LQALWEIVEGEDDRGRSSLLHKDNPEDRMTDKAPELDPEGALQDIEYVAGRLEGNEHERPMLVDAVVALRAYLAVTQDQELTEEEREVIVLCLADDPMLWAATQTPVPKLREARASARRKLADRSGG
jgi:hypothetical protein